MENTNIINISTEKSYNLNFGIKGWCSFLINHGYALSYNQIKNLSFVLEAERDNAEDVVLSDQDIRRLMKMYYEKNVKGRIKKRVAEIVLGLPGCGKSTYLNQKNKGCVICDCDLVKELMPEYDGGLGNERCHNASKIVLKELIKKLSFDGYKLGIQIIGKNQKSFDEIYDILVSKGYKIFVKYIKTSKINALNNSLKRFIETGRLVSFDYINEIREEDIDAVYYKVINYPNVIKRDGDFEKRERIAKKLFSVKAKCGHVGINYYIEKEFLCFASDKKEAATNARYFKRVKHDHKDAIIDVREIDFYEGRELWMQNEINPYLNCKNSSQQKEFKSDLEIHEEKKVSYKKVVDKNRKIKQNKYKNQRCRDDIRRFKEMEEYE